MYAMLDLSEKKEIEIQLRIEHMYVALLDMVKVVKLASSHTYHELFLQTSTTVV